MEQRQANSDEKRVYDRIVLQALRFIMQSEQASAVTQLAQQGDPAEAVAASAAMVLKQVVAAAQQAKKNITPAYLYPAAKEIMMHIIEMLVAFGVVPKEEARAVLGRAQNTFAFITTGGKK